MTLATGETETINFKLIPDQLRFYDRVMNFTAEPGTIQVFVGTHSADVLKTEFRYID